MTLREEMGKLQEATCQDCPGLKGGCPLEDFPWLCQGDISTILALFRKEIEGVSITHPIYPGFYRDIREYRQALLELVKEEKDVATG